MKRLLRHFLRDADDYEVGESVGMEVETSFVDLMYNPITVAQSQALLRHFANRRGWDVGSEKGGLITQIQDGHGNKILYELGRQNIELATIPLLAERVVAYARRILEDLYKSGEEVGAYPCFWPVLETNEELTFIPDERDSIWLKIDGRPALELLARISAVQFTIAVPRKEAIRCLNRLGKHIGLFLRDYPQEVHWRRYIKESKAGYHPLRYGGPLFFRDWEDYCEQLAEHDVVPEQDKSVAPRLMPYAQVKKLDVSMFIRSIWWYFRLRRYKNALCVEVRPLARHTDREMQGQLDSILDILG